MKKEDITPQTLIPMNRLTLFAESIIENLEEKDKETSAKIKEIKKRMKSKKIQISREAKEELSVKAAQVIMETIRKSINAIYIKENSVRISKEIIDKAEDL